MGDPLAGRTSSSAVGSRTLFWREAPGKVLDEVSTAIHGDEVAVNGAGEELVTGSRVYPGAWGVSDSNRIDGLALRATLQLLTRPDGFDAKRRTHRCESLVFKERSELKIQCIRLLALLSCFSCNE